MRRRGPLVVVGDSMLDVDLLGSATRLCPDAPVPVVDLGERWERPGGAGLAALLAVRSGVEVVLVTALGEDDAAVRLADLLEGLEVELRPLRLVGGTVVKTRVAASGVPMLRLDSGAGRPAGGVLPRSVEAALAGAAAVLVADYGRGVAALPALRRRLSTLAAGVPVVWDPHPKGPVPVRHAALATPNAAEAAHFGGGADAADSGRRLCDQWGVQAVAVTHGERGAWLTRAGSRSVQVPLVGSATTAGHPRPDTCGAGDQFAVSATAALLGGADVESAVRTAVMEAAAYVTAGAAATVSVRVPAVVDVEVASDVS